jgi:hypothetical protein
MSEKPVSDFSQKLSRQQQLMVLRTGVVSRRYRAGLVKFSLESGNDGVVSFLARALGDRQEAANRDAPAMGISLVVVNDTH